MRVTITAQNVFNTYGIAMPAGSIQTLADDFGKSLVQAQKATDTDGVLTAQPNDPYSRGRIVAAPSAVAQLNGQTLSATDATGAAVTATILGDEVYDATRTYTGALFTVAATGMVMYGPGRVLSIRCTAGVTPTLTIRDVVIQTQAGTDTTSPVIFPATTMAIGDVIKVAIDANFGVHATVSGAGASFILEF